MTHWRIAAYEIDKLIDHPMSEVCPAEKTACSDNTPVYQSCASGQLCGEDQELDRKHNQLLYQYFGMLYMELDVHYTARAKKLATCSWFHNWHLGEGPFVVILSSSPWSDAWNGYCLPKKLFWYDNKSLYFLLLARQTSHQVFSWPWDETHWWRLLRMTSWVRCKRREVLAFGLGSHISVS